MEDGETPDHYFTYDGRLASFQAGQPVSRQKSSKSKTPKALAWPHKRIDPKSVCGLQATRPMQTAPDADPLRV